jgi:hypothetical protein
MGFEVDTELNRVCEARRVSNSAYKLGQGEGAMACALAKLLNRHRYADALEAHWCRPLVTVLSRIFMEEDPMGLFGFLGMPADEYEPEALLTLALLCGFPDYDAFLAACPESAGRALLDEATDAAVLAATERAFVMMFGSGGDVARHLAPLCAEQLRLF